VPDDVLMVADHARVLGPGASPRLESVSRSLVLLRNLVARNLKVKYQRSFLGFVWTLLNPLGTTLTLIVVFGTVVRLGVDHYWAFLLSGFFVFNSVNAVVNAATYALPQHAAVIRAANVNAEVFVLAGVASRLLEFVIELALVVGAIAIFHHRGMPPSFLLLPVLLLAHFLFVVGIVLPVATLGAFYDDLQHSLPVLFTILFYVSPVFYPASMVPANLTAVYHLNPLANLLGLYQRVLYEGAFPTFDQITAMMLVAGIACLAGGLVFRRFRAIFPEVL
jgi:ABC-type polysaccharide/polyol phosphate export permease